MEMRFESNATSAGPGEAHATRTLRLVTCPPWLRSIARRSQCAASCLLDKLGASWTGSSLAKSISPETLMLPNTTDLLRLGERARQHLELAFAHGTARSLLGFDIGRAWTFGSRPSSPFRTALGYGRSFGGLSRGSRAQAHSRNPA